jgi:hypothetical protein
VGVEGVGAGAVGALDPHPDSEAPRSASSVRPMGDRLDAMRGWYTFIRMTPTEPATMSAMVYVAFALPLEAWKKIHFG